MGCGSSKMAAVAPSPQLLPQSTHDDGAQHERQNSSTSTGSRKSIKFRQNKISPKQVDESMSMPGVIKVQEAADIQHRNSNGSESNSSQYSSRESISSSSTRLISAHSTESNGSQDSGLGEEYSHVITEGSDSREKEVAKLPQGMEKPDLVIEGEKIKIPSSVGHRQRPARLPPIQISEGSPSSGKNSTPSVPTKRVMFSNSLIDELPDSPSIVKKPCAKGGLAFDIVLNDTPIEPNTVAKRKPAHLKKLEQKRGGNVSHKELDEKQRAAEQRRKEQSQMLLERFRAKQEKDRQVAEALARFAAMQTEIKNGVHKKIESTTDNREAYLNAMRNRLREKSQRVEEVKRAKKLEQANTNPTAQNDDTPVN